MATIPAVTTVFGTLTGMTGVLFFYETVTQADQPAEIALDAEVLTRFNGKVPIEMIVHADGTFDGASFTVQGAFDAAFTNAFTLRDRAGTDAALSAAGYFSVGDLPPYIRVLRASGTASDVDINVFLRVKVA